MRERIETRPGQYIRAGWAIPQNPRGLVLIFPGLSEYIEKYYEVANDLLARNFAVACMDWRGQGLSWRYGDAGKRRHDSFDNDLIDAAAFAGAIPVPASMPRVILGHSMGGHAALRLMHSMRDAFRCAVLTAPMLGIKLPVPESFARNLARMAALFKKNDSYLPASGAWTSEHFEANILKLTSDPIRRDIQRYWMKQEGLRMGGLTFDWIKAAFESLDTLRDPKYLSKITTPCLMITAGSEAIVDNAATATAAKSMPNTEIMTIPGSLHEIMMEQDRYRMQFWTAFDGFIAKHLGVG